jgi:galactose mutarotase-like enzyme
VPDQESPWVSLRSGNLAAEINPLGAQLSSLRDEAGRDLLWDGDPAVWNGRSPLLFPIIGTLAGGRYRLGSNTYPLPRHGFARGKRFEIVDLAPAAATFRLTSDDATFQVYPFRFELEVRYALEQSTLSITARVRNKGDQAMPASFGYHPALRWPLPYGQPRSAHFLEFASEEPAPIRRLNADGLLTPELHPTPVVHRRLDLTDALFQDDVIIFDAIRSRSVTYGADAGPCVSVSFPDAPYLGLWMKPRANFICIEPWHGLADLAGFSGDFRTKTGVFMVAPGAAVPITMTLTLLSTRGGQPMDSTPRC